MAKAEATKIKILVVDDHPVVRFGISAMINTQPDMAVVADTGNGEEALALYRQYRPDLTVMDLRLEGMNGADCIRNIRAEFPDAVFVVLTTYRGDEDIHQALEAGATGYLIKGMPRHELIEALRKAHCGKSFLPSTVNDVLATRKPENALSARELDVLMLLSAGKCNKEIAAALSIAEITVKCHLSQIYRRLGVTDRTQAIVVAAKRGFIHV
jgi:DNA-binding NarL/FixJ family response regulator